MARKPLRSQLNQIRAWVRQGRADAWIAPIETVSNSESGFERVYQGSCLVLSRPVNLRPGAATAFRIAHAVSVATDRAALEPRTEAAPAG